MESEKIQLVSKTSNSPKIESSMNQIYVFKTFKLDLRKEKLYQNNQEVRIEKRMFQFLSLLIKNSPEAVSKNDLMDNLWKNQVVTEWSLSRLVSDTRKILGDDGKSQKFIKTNRGEGFSFSAKVQLLDSNGVSIDRRKNSLASKTSAFNKLYLLPFFFLVLAFAGAYQYNASQKINKFELVKELEQNLILTKTSHQAQKKRRNELGEMLEKRFNLNERRDWENFFNEYYPQYNEKELFIHEQIRAITDGPIYKGNSNILKILKDNPELANDFPSFQALYNHLSFWINKYEKVFNKREDMCLLYSGEEDGVPFPSSIDKEVADWLAKK